MVFMDGGVPGRKLAELSLEPFERFEPPHVRILPLDLLSPKAKRLAPQPDGEGWMQLADSLDGLTKGGKIDVERHGEAEGVRLLLVDQAQQGGKLRVGAQEVGVPAVHLRDVRHHPPSHLMELFGDAGDDQGAPGRIVGEELGRHHPVHHILGHGGGPVLGGDGDLVALPQFAHPVERGAEEV